MGVHCLTLSSKLVGPLERVAQHHHAHTPLRVAPGSAVAPEGMCAARTVETTHSDPDTVSVLTQRSTCILSAVWNSGNALGHSTVPRLQCRSALFARFAGSPEGEDATQAVRPTTTRLPHVPAVESCKAFLPPPTLARSTLSPTCLQFINRHTAAQPRVA